MIHIIHDIYSIMYVVSSKFLKVNMMKKNIFLYYSPSDMQVPIGHIGILNLGLQPANYS